MRFLLGGPRLFGLRTGVIFGRRDLEKLLGDRSGIGGMVAADLQSALYVVKGEHNRIKIGITGNTERRINELRTGSAYHIEYAWIGIPDGDADLIERDALDMLRAHKAHRDWFAVAPEAGVGAICCAAHRRGRHILEVSPEMAERIRVASESAALSAAPDTARRGRALLLAFALALAAVVVGVAALMLNAPALPY